VLLAGIRRGHGGAPWPAASQHAGKALEATFSHGRKRERERAETAWFVELNAAGTASSTAFFAAAAACQERGQREMRAGGMRLGSRRDSRTAEARGEWGSGSGVRLLPTVAAGHCGVSGSGWGRGRR